MKSLDVIKNIMNEITDELIISSTGIISREIYSVKDRPENFYVMGSLGSSLGIGIGLAMNKPDRKVIVIAGDGDILMSLGTLVLMNKLKLKNLELIIIDNNCYLSTGGQPTCSDAIDFTKMADCKVFKTEAVKSDVGRIKIKHEALARRFYNAINGVQ